MSLFRICGLLVGSGLSARHPFLVKSVAWQAIIVKKPVANVAASVIRSVRDSWQSNKVIGHLFKSGRIKGVFGTFSFGLLGIQLSSPSHEKHKKNRLVGLDPGIELVEDTSFWRQLLAYLLPHWFGLLVAVTCAMAVAVLNIEIPQMLGSIVNVVATYAKNEGAGEESFMQDIKGPAMKMVKLYLAQSIMTFGYIYSLSCVGERVAAQMRQDLFSSVICQDIAFFDNHKCGEIVSRLTSDVQDFKSSFKLCISQGLRSLTQTVGCGVALYSISPQMTGIMLLVVPTVIITGTGLGSLLRSLSKKAQSQIAKATAVGEECISNIRTVRAFAMEATEEELYNREVDKSRSINELLGLGIGVFQAGSNLFLNGIVLTTLYCGGYLLSSNRLSPGELMSFLVATQTIQRSLAQMSLMFGQFIKGKIFLYK